MKSNQNESRLETSCEDCYFAKYDGNTQTGCAMGRLETLLEKRPEYVVEAYGQDGKEFSVIQEFCTFFRNPTGRHHSADTAEQIAEVKETVRKNSAPRFCILINADKLSSIHEVGNLTSTLKKGGYYKEKIDVLIYHKSNDNEEKRKTLAGYYDKLSKLVRRCRILEMSKDLSGYSHTYELYRHVSATYTVETTPEELDISFLSDIDNSINEDLERGLFFVRNGVEAISFAAFRAYFKKGETHDEFKKDFRKRCKKEGFLVEL